MYHLTSHSAATGFEPVHLLLLVLFAAIFVGHILRLTLFRQAIFKAYGHFDWKNELANLFCAALMLPMLAGAFTNGALRAWSVWLALAGVACFLFSQLVYSFKPRDAAVGGMFLGMAFMYFSYNYLTGSVFATSLFAIFGIFYFISCLYHFAKLFNFRKEQNSRLRLFLMHSELSHLIVTLTMLAMIVWPAGFRAIA